MHEPSAHGVPTRHENDWMATIQRYLSHHPHDWALFIDLSKGASFGTFSEPVKAVGFGKRVVWGGPELDPEEKKALWTYPIADRSAKAWRRARDMIADKAREVASACATGRIHVFFDGPYGAAAYLGSQLDEVARAKEVFAYQFYPKEKVLRPMVVPASVAEDEGQENYFQPTEQAPTVSGPEGGIGVALSLEGRRDHETGLLREMVDRLNLARAFRVCPAGERWVTSSRQATGAVAQVEELLDRLHRDYPGQPLHIVTSLPVSLLIGLGRSFSSTVWSSVIVHGLNLGNQGSSGGAVGDSGGEGDAPQGPFYYPTMDIVSGRIFSDDPRHLRVFVGDGGFVMYRLDQEVLPVARKPETDSGGVSRRGMDKTVLMQEVKVIADHLLPDPVDNACEKWRSVDVEINVNDLAAELPWEYMFSRKVDEFIALREGCVLARVDPSGGRVPPRRRDTPLRVLIAPVISEDDYAKYEAFLRIQAIDSLLRTRNVACEVLPPGATIEQIRSHIANHRPDVFQWIGHGGVDDPEAYPPIAELSGQDGSTYLDRILFHTVVGAGWSPRVVLLTSCNLGSGVMEYGVPRNLHHDEVGVVISYRDPVTVKEVGIFAMKFYDQLTLGKTVGEAVRAARVALYVASEKREVPYPGAFAAPVLSCRSFSALAPLVDPPASDLEVPVSPESSSEVAARGT